MLFERYNSVLILCKQNMHAGECLLTVNPNFFSASTPTRGAAQAATAPSKQRSKAKIMLRMCGGTISAKAGLLHAGAAQVPRLFIATRANIYRTTVPVSPFWGRPCTPNKQGCSSVEN